MDFEAACDEIDQIIETRGVDDRIREFRGHADALQPGEDGRAQFLTSLAGELELTGDMDGARAAVLAAIEDGGPTALDPRCGILGIEIAAGHEERVAELLQYFLAQVRAGAFTVTECEWVADTLEEADRLRGAHRWFTIPLRDIDPSAVDELPPGSLHGRWRVRRALGLPLDAYDDARDLLVKLQQGPS